MLSSVVSFDAQVDCWKSMVLTEFSIRHCQNKVLLDLLSVWLLQDIQLLQKFSLVIIFSQPLIRSSMRLRSIDTDLVDSSIVES